MKKRGRLIGADGAQKRIAVQSGPRRLTMCKKNAGCLKKQPYTYIRLLQTVDKLNEILEFVYSPFYFACEWGLLISIPGASLSAGRAVSLLAAKAPAGSHLSR